VARIALIAYGVYLALAFGLRTAVQLRRTGASGFKGVSGRPGSAEWFAGVLFVLALLVGVAAPVPALTDVVEPIEGLDTTAVHVVGIVLFIIGLAGTLAAQVAMGESWRIGVDESERTELVTEGPFAVARNPIFSAMLPTSLGLVLMVPSWVALVGLAALVVALELQVRVVEEPYLQRTHGRTYLEYARRVGRFLPAVGRLPGGPSARDGGSSAAQGHVGLTPPEQNKALVRRLLEEVVNQGNDDALDEIAVGQIAEEARRWIGPFREAFPDFQMEIVDLVAEGDKVAAHFRCSGTHRGEWRGRSPTGRRFEAVDEVYFFTVEDGRLGSATVVEDNLARMQQLGIEP
jgi:protein-S-isoprenylcysteine O-methyltransferase Ste14/predicted ester cyclase